MTTPTEIVRQAYTPAVGQVFVKHFKPASTLNADLVGDPNTSLRSQDGDASYYALFIVGGSSRQFTLQFADIEVSNSTRSRFLVLQAKAVVHSGVNPGEAIIGITGFGRMAIPTGGAYYPFRVPAPLLTNDGMGRFINVDLLAAENGNGHMTVTISAMWVEEESPPGMLTVRHDMSSLVVSDDGPGQIFTTGTAPWLNSDDGATSTVNFQTLLFSNGTIDKQTARVTFPGFPLPSGAEIVSVAAVVTHSRLFGGQNSEVNLLFGLDPPTRIDGVGSYVVGPTFTQDIRPLAQVPAQLRGGNAFRCDITLDSRENEAGASIRITYFALDITYRLPVNLTSVLLPARLLTLNSSSPVQPVGATDIVNTNDGDTSYIQPNFTGGNNEFFNVVGFNAFGKFPLNSLPTGLCRWHVVGRSADGATTGTYNFTVASDLGNSEFRGAQGPGYTDEAGPFFAVLADMRANREWSFYTGDGVQGVRRTTGSLRITQIFLEVFYSPVSPTAIILSGAGTAQGAGAAAMDAVASATAASALLQVSPPATTTTITSATATADSFSPMIGRRTVMTDVTTTPIVSTVTGQGTASAVVGQNAAAAQGVTVLTTLPAAPVGGTGGAQVANLTSTGNSIADGIVTAAGSLATNIFTATATLLADSTATITNAGVAVGSAAGQPVTANGTLTALYSVLQPTVGANDYRLQGDAVLSCVATFIPRPRQLDAFASAALDGIVTSSAFFTNEGQFTVATLSGNSTLTVTGSVALPASRGQQVNFLGALTGRAIVEDPFFAASNTRLDGTSTMTANSVSNVFLAAGRTDAGSLLGIAAEIVNVIVFQAAITALSQVTATALAAVSTIAMVQPVEMIRGTADFSARQLGDDQITARSFMPVFSEMVATGRLLVNQARGEFVYLNASMDVSSVTIDVKQRSAALEALSSLTINVGLVTEPPQFLSASLSAFAQLTSTAEFFPAGGPFGMLFAESTFTGDARALNINYVSSELREEGSRLIAFGQTFFSPGDPFATVALKANSRLLAPVAVEQPRSGSGSAFATSSLTLIDIAVGSAKHLRGRTFLNTNTDDNFPPDLRAGSRLLAVSEATNRSRTAAPVTAFTTTTFTATPNTPVFRPTSDLVSLSEAKAVGAYVPVTVDGRMVGRTSNSTVDIETGLITRSNLTTRNEDGKSRLHAQSSLLAQGENLARVTASSRLPSTTSLMAKPVVHPAEGISASILTNSYLVAAFTFTPTADAQTAAPRVTTAMSANINLVGVTNASLLSNADTTAVGGHLVTDLNLHFRTPTSLTNTTLVAVGFSVDVFGTAYPNTATALIAVPVVTGGLLLGTALPTGRSRVVALGATVEAPDKTIGFSRQRGQTLIAALGFGVGGGIEFGVCSPIATTNLRAAFVVTQTHDAKKAEAQLTTVMSALPTKTNDAASVMATTLTTECLGANTVETATVQRSLAPATASLIAAGVFDQTSDFSMDLPAFTDLIAVGSASVLSHLPATTSLIAFGTRLVTEVFYVSDPNPNFLTPATHLLAAGEFESVGSTRRLWATTILLSHGVTEPPPHDGRSAMRAGTGANAEGTTTLRPVVFAEVDDTLKFTPTPRRSQ